MQEQFGAAEYSHVPQTFDLPQQHAQLIQTMKDEPSSLWIYKPSGGARGNGIKLVWEPGQVERDTVKAAVQRYIESPYLIENRKMHLRLYVVVREIDPLRILLFEDGLALLAGQPYSDNPNERGNVHVHLTNAAMSKGAAKDPAADAAYAASHRDVDGDADDEDGERSRTTWSLLPFLDDLEQKGLYDVPQVLADISDAVVKTMLSGQANERFTDRRPGSCFDMFGIDVMFDDRPNPQFGGNSNNNKATVPARTLKPYVLELNLAPQMGGDEQSVRALDARPVCAAFSFSLSFSLRVCLCFCVLLCACLSMSWDRLTLLLCGWCWIRPRGVTFCSLGLVDVLSLGAGDRICAASVVCACRV